MSPSRPISIWQSGRRPERPLPGFWNRAKISIHPCVEPAQSRAPGVDKSSHRRLGIRDVLSCQLHLLRSGFPRRRERQSPAHPPRVYCACAKNSLLFQHPVFDSRLFSGRDIPAVDEPIRPNTHPRIIRVTPVLRAASLSNPGKAVLVHGATHVTLIPECQPVLVTCAPSVTAHCCVSAS